MSWEGLLQARAEDRVVAPWIGGAGVWASTRWWAVRQRPPAWGWYGWTVDRNALIHPEPVEPPADLAAWFREPGLASVCVGDRAWPLRGGDPLHLPLGVEEPFTLARVARHRDGAGYVTQALFAGEIEERVRAAAMGALPLAPDALSGIPGVTPAHRAAFDLVIKARVDAAFRVLAIQREEQQARMRAAGATAEGRRLLAAEDPAEGVRRALEVAGAQLVGTRKLADGLVVDWRCDGQPMQCVVDVPSLRVRDAGFCLTDHVTGRRGDADLTLESLVGTCREAIATRKLVRLRHAADEDAGDEDSGGDPWT